MRRTSLNFRYMENRTCINLIKIIILFCAFLAFSGCGKENEVFVIEETADPLPEAGPFEDEKIIIYICGEVNRPGVYTLSEGSRIADAVDAAGGAAVNADLMKLNLAQKLADGQQVIVPSVTEGTRTGEAQTSGKVNLNRATKGELMTLPGIGESRAEAIIAYREKAGWIAAPEELMNVSGIAEKMYEKIADLIEV